MLRSIVQTPFGSREIAVIEEALSHLAVRNGQTLFIADHAVTVERPGKGRDGPFPLPLTGFLKGEIVVEDAQGAVVVQRAKQVKCFKVIRTGLLWMVRSNVQVAEVDQCMGDGMGVLLCSLEGQHLPVALFGCLVFVHQGVGVAEISQRIGEFALIIGSAIVGYRRFPSGLGLYQITTMKKDSRAVLVIV